MSGAAYETGVPPVFVCHAQEDKESVARPLATALARLGMLAWLDTDQLRIGDRLRFSIDSAISTCELAVVIFSPDFYRSPWASRYELDGIVNRFVAGELLLLPVLHNVDRTMVLARAPSLGSCISRSTADCTVAEIAREIAGIGLPGHRGVPDDQAAGVGVSAW